MSKTDVAPVHRCTGAPVHRGAKSGRVGLDGSLGGGEVWSTLTKKYFLWPRENKECLSFVRIGELSVGTDAWLSG